MILPLEIWVLISYLLEPAHLAIVCKLFRDIYDSAWYVRILPRLVSWFSLLEQYYRYKQSYTIEGINNIIRWERKSYLTCFGELFRKNKLIATGVRDYCGKTYSQGRSWYTVEGVLITMAKTEFQKVGNIGSRCYAVTEDYLYYTCKNLISFKVIPRDFTRISFGKGILRLIDSTAIFTFGPLRESWTGVTKLYRDGFLLQNGKVFLISPYRRPISFAYTPTEQVKEVVYDGNYNYQILDGSTLYQGTPFHGGTFNVTEKNVHTLVDYNVFAFNGSTTN